MKGRFGLLKVIGLAPRPPGSTQRCLFWRCRCKCGNIVVVRGTFLRNGHTTCCGCDGIDRTPIDNGDGSFSIKLACGRKIVVDAGDLQLVTEFRWRSSEHKNTFYAVTGVGKNRRYLHRLLIPARLIDHRDGNGLNNRRNNLRVATTSQNQANQRKSKSRITSSRYKGVSLHKQTGKWVAWCADWYLGLFVNEKEAAEMYDIAAVMRYGKFARLNFPK